MAEVGEDVREKVAAQKERDFVRFHEFEARHEASLRLDEETDLSERLFIPMENTFHYELKDDKLYSEFGDQLEEIFIRGYVDLREYATTRPDLTFEINRRYQDILEVRQAETLQPGETMVVFSPIPDDVRYGRTHIDAYNRERLKMLVRVYEHAADTPNGFSITSFSLDGSNYAAMQAAAQRLGIDIPDGLGSEDIVQQRHVFTANDERLEVVRQEAQTGKQTVSKAMVDALRQGYDDSLEEQLGGQWHAGRPALNEADALSFIRSQPEIFEAHMKQVKTIIATVRDVATQKQRLADARYNCAAALDDLLHGKRVDSLEQAGADARAEGRDYSGDCITTPVTSTEQQAERLGYRVDSLKCVVCPLPKCGRVVDAKRTAQGGIYCPACRREARGGKIIEHTAPESSTQQSSNEAWIFSTKIVEKQPALRFQHEIAIGTAVVTAMAPNGQVIATGDEARSLYYKSQRQA
ncbi:MAG TPA: hypothetical protein VD907_00280 [Verrucomicrobiae bacterium]|nr:hypothetical protein [Verrucomicrobiae bacterium]